MAPDPEPLRALYAQYQAEPSGGLILQGLQTWAAGEMALAATRFEQARDSFEPDQSPQEWMILDEWVGAAADIFLEQAEAAIASGQMPSYKAYNPSQKRDPKGSETGGRFTASGAGVSARSMISSLTPKTKPTSTPRAKPGRTVPPAVSAVEDKFYAGSDAQKLGWNREEFGQIVDGLEATINATGRIAIPTTMQEALGWAKGGKIAAGAAQFGMNTSGLINLVLDSDHLGQAEAIVGTDRVPAVNAPRVIAAMFAGTMSHIYAPALADIFQSGYAPFWLMRNMAIVMGDRVKGVRIEAKDGFPLDAVRGILMLGKVGQNGGELQSAFKVGVVEGDSSDDLLDVADFPAPEEPKPVKKAMTVSNSERVRRAWATRRQNALQASNSVIDSKFALRASQRLAGGIPSRYTAGRMAQLSTALRQAQRLARAKNRIARRFEHQSNMSGGRTLKELVAEQVELSALTIFKHLGPGPHPNGTSQDIHDGGAGNQADLERAIAGHEHEVGYFVQNGKVLPGFVGGEDSVDVSKVDRASVKGAIFVHNHPDDSAISTLDVSTSRKLGVREIVAVTRDKAQVLRPTGGRDFSEMSDDDYWTLGEQLELQGMKLRRELLEEGKDVSDFAQQVWAKVAPRVGLEYFERPLKKHMGGPDGTAPHPDGSSQDIHAGDSGWKSGIGAILRQKVSERLEQVKLKTGETKERKVIETKFTYADGTDVQPDDLAYLKKLGIGPAYTEVRVNPDFKTDGLVASMVDEKGRAVRLYSKAHTKNAAQEKFERLKAFNAAMPGMQKRIRADMDSTDPKTKAAARVLYLVEKTAFRIGSDRDTGADKQAYGASTLQVKHATVEGDTITFKFVGKKGVSQKHKIKDAELARLVTEQMVGKEPTAKLWEADDNDVRAYLVTLPKAKHFLVKDFRTWNATALAVELIAKAKQKLFTDEKAFAKFQKVIATKVSKRLGNNPKMAMDSYIDYHTWDAVRDPTLGAWLPKKMQ